MDDSRERLDALIRSGARRLTGYQRRQFQAEVATELCGGSPRRAERRFGWGRAIVEPHAYADPELKSARRYTNLSAAEVRAALRAKGYAGDRLPSERAMRDILNRMNYRLKRIRKGKPLKKTQQTDAIFANVRAVQQQARDDPATREISMDTKAKVALGEYVRGGKNPDRLRR